MAEKIEDPLTGTTWLKTNDLSGSAKTIVMAAVGIAMLFSIMGIAQSTIQPFLNGLINQLPGVSTGEDTGLVVA